MGVGNGVERERSALGRLFFERRQEIGMTQEQLAQAAGISKRDVERYEGTMAPRGDTFLLLLSALGLEVEGIPSPKAINRELLDLRQEIESQGRVLGVRLATIETLAVANSKNTSETLGVIEDLGKGIEARLDALESQLRAREQ